MKSCAALSVGFHALVLAWVALGAVGACGGEKWEPKSAEEAGEVPPPPAETAPAPAESAPAAEPKPDPETKPEGANKAEPVKDPNAMREVRYVVTPEGLKIEVAGVRFLASAEAK